MAKISTYTTQAHNERVPVFQLEPGDMMLGLGEVISKHRVDPGYDKIVVVWRSQIMADDIISEVWNGREQIVVVRAKPETRVTVDLSMAEARRLHEIIQGTGRFPGLEDLEATIA
ncbi:MAG TPA: hypothetical protein VNM39_11960 [Verrucomicrobiae bacterium]|nr:hypothetical protein [Verrucomicrobiae bacterium]